MAKNNDNGIGFTGLLQIVFITLKLLNKITWGWAWVFAPTWIYASIIILIVVLSIWRSIKKEVRENEANRNKR